MVPVVFFHMRETVQIYGNFSNDGTSYFVAQCNGRNEVGSDHNTILAADAKLGVWTRVYKLTCQFPSTSAIR